MGLGVLEATIPAGCDHVPGTATLESLKQPAVGTSPAASLKRAKDGQTILVPQPSDDPRDPLNWPLWKRDLITGILCLLSVIASTLSPLLAANSLTLLLYFGRSFADIALLTGWHLLGVGVAGFIFVASARVWGKRHLYILGTVIIIVSSVWGGASGRNYNSLAAARFFQGVGLAPFEALVNASVGELYFVHESGKRMALSNLCLFGGAFFTPVIVGKLTSSLGWQWTFYFIAIFSAVLLPMVVLFVPETAYRRDAAADRNTLNSSEGSGNHVLGESTQSPASSLEKEPRIEASDTDNTQISHKFLSKDSLGLFNGRKTDESFLTVLVRPLPLLFHPAMLWAMLIQGALIGWTVFIGIVLAAIMIGPPLLFDEVKTGYMYTGAFIGAVLGFALAGLIADSVPKWMARRNGGIFEPEFRLVLVIPQMIFGCAGLYGFGFVAANPWKYGWFWPDFFFALEVMGMVLGAVASALYIVDAHRDLTVEGFTCLLIFKNIFSFALTFEAYDWLLVAGTKQTFIDIGSVQAAVCLVTVFMYVFGKKNRSFFARHDFLRKLYLK